MPVYLDAASGAPLHPAARAALLAALDDGWADPARLHGAGRRARLLLDAAREAVAEVVGARPDEVSFTASGTMAAFLGVLGTAAPRRGTTVAHSAVEHSAVLQAAGSAGLSLPVDAAGRVLPVDVDPDWALVCLQAANHEVGTTQPVADVAARCAGAGVPLLVDASHALGRAPVPTGWSVLTASARTWGGPPGVGLLVVRTGTRWRSPLPDDERPDRSPGRLDLPAVVAAAAGLQAAAAEAAAEDARLRALVDLVRGARVEGVTAVGDPLDRLPHLVTLVCEGVDSEELLRALDARDLQVSSGSSCSASSIEPSHVLAAMGAPTDGSVRLSLHRGTTRGDVERFLAVLPPVLAELRAAVP
ncbi:MAG: aminotransferase class V-fold PLP-dependent enzyme [Mycobacteriales bacterium]|nr:aminotransferase class V-fold PLP-dependent enzyme [Mycobacteriales bacterium]